MRCTGCSRSDGWRASMRRDVSLIDARLDRAHVYTQVPAFAASDGGMLDLLSVDRDGPLAVMELKADEDLHLALQGLDYWVRVRWHHRQNPDRGGRAGRVSAARVLWRREAGGERSAAVSGGAGAARASGNRRGAALSVAAGGVGAGCAGRALAAAD